MLHNCNWDVCPDWVRFAERDAKCVCNENDAVPHRENEKKKDKEKQTHVHEFLGSTEIAEEEFEPHNHRFAGVSGEAIPAKGSHIHKILTRTDFFDEHFHEIEDFTGPAIEVGNGKHVHFAKGETTFNDGHDHDFQFATLIENPLQSKKRC